MNPGPYAATDDEHLEGVRSKVDEAADTEIPDSVQVALANVLNAQFELGVTAGERGRRNIGRKDCLPMNDALKALVRELRVALDAAQTDAYAEGRADEREAYAPVLDAFDEHDACDAWSGLPIEFFNPGPTFS